MSSPAEALLERARSVTLPLRPSFPFERRFHGLTARPAAAGGSEVFMHHVDEGPRDGAGTVLCVHGNPTWSFYWRRIIAELSGEARVVAPDHLGMGLSSRVKGGVRLAEHVAALTELIDTLDLDDITLVCHDWGGAIGFGAVKERPRRFRSFVVTNTAAFPSSLMPRRIAACRVPGLGRLAVQGGNAFARAALRMTTVVPLTEEARRGLIAPYDSWAQREQIWRFVEDIPLKETHPSWGTLCAIGDSLADRRGLPMELVWGMRDWCFSPAFLDQWRQRFPDAAVSELDGAGHYLNEDAPEAVIAAIRRVMRANQRGSVPA